MKHLTLTALLVGCTCTNPATTTTAHYKFSKEIDGKAVVMTLIPLPGNNPRAYVEWVQPMPPVGRFLGLNQGTVITWEPLKSGTYPVTLTANLTTRSVQFKFMVVDGKVSPDNWTEEYR